MLTEPPIQKVRADYSVVSQTEQSQQRNCSSRADHLGLWNVIKAWYLFAVHVVLYVVTAATVIHIDNHEFQIGSGFSIFTFHSPLHQSQVTGLLSLALVVVRLVAGAGSTLLVWRIIFILLENRGVTLLEFTRTISFRLPILPAIEAERSLFWSLWATIALALMWPHGFAAPLASSSISWIPSHKLRNHKVTASIERIGDFAHWDAITHADWRATTVISAAALTANEPQYAFVSESIQLRRYFNPNETIPTSSRISLPLPYLATNLRWISATDNENSQHAGNATYSDVSYPFRTRATGATAIIMDEKWDPKSQIPNQASVLKTTKLVAVRVSMVPSEEELAKGRLPSDEDECPTVSAEFGKLPPVAQKKVAVAKKNGTLTAYDCYVLAEVAMTAGIYRGQDCKVVSSNSTSQSYATCSVPRDDEAIEEDWLHSLSLDFTSEVIKYSILQDFTHPRMSPDLDTYVTGMLTMGYHATWSTLMRRLGNYAELISYQKSEDAVFVSVDSQKLYIWLSMNATLTLAAVIVFGASMKAKTKTVRDATLASLTMDLSDILHRPETSGLCTAVSLNDKDHKLPRLRWQNAVSGNDDNTDQATTLHCRKIILAKDSEPIVPLTIIKGAGHEHIPIPEGECAIIADFHSVKSQSAHSTPYLTTGFYRVVPGPTRYGEYDYEETKYVLKGQIDITDEATGKTHHLVAGDWAFFHVGSKAQFSTKTEGVAFYAVTRPKNDGHPNLVGREEDVSKL
ncbi:uncharacterized protein B0J16DRAFT_387943 [Fusarium flagelliforme]|uniref:uncharacterized protein n=1 Tax=Fusarium flagelliforme TaxID=2675880 RepID=UPI001E8CA07C|nr:uncharacterized protein B0J16DRAFT_387943 [Fusarium flagelliforme]KAH7174118.1 hypothetical protein B0J16DRAFT_387943 [Fusarium flagelliforme]